MKSIDGDTKNHLDQIIVEEVTEEPVEGSKTQNSLTKETITLHHFILNKIYDHKNKAMCLQIVKVLEGNKAEMKKQIRIRSIFHLFGLATLDINPEYISYA